MDAQHYRFKIDVLVWCEDKDWAAIVSVGETDVDGKGRTPLRAVNDALHKLAPHWVHLAETRVMDDIATNQALADARKEGG